MIMIIGLYTAKAMTMKRKMMVMMMMLMMMMMMVMKVTYWYCRSLVAGKATNLLQEVATSTQQLALLANTNMHKYKKLYKSRGPPGPDF